MWYTFCDFYLLKKRLSFVADDCCARPCLFDLFNGHGRCQRRKRNATWLIMPVVICLSQRLSHACVSMN
ncbi:hypothetical protein RHMOL_Rhmol11G0046000 [Rhododendron molle]|uniref:Uncharacterized protein n=1 Tax=Rhododendron molle TaxID=49168 RepID=A0ACC0LPV7_RHOML|nr:hypothetical protein RHMOL_Rhmol11G0046000 [Rhododendron molle]